MSWFNNKNKNFDPVPKGVKLMKKTNEVEGLLIDELTVEILKRDINIMRQTHEFAVKHLGSLPGFGKYLEAIEDLVVRFGNAYDEMMRYLKSSGARQEANQKSLIETQNKIIKTQNKIIETINLIIETQNHLMTFAQSKGGRLLETAPTVGITRVVVAKDQTGTGNRRQNNMSLSKDKPEKEDKPSAHETLPPFIESEENCFEEQIESLVGSNESSSTENRAASILKKIKNIILAITGENFTVRERSAENLLGLQVRNAWFVALPPKSDGTYDHTDLQASFRTINAHRLKGEKAIAVCEGVMSDKNFKTGNNTARAMKIRLTGVHNFIQTLVEEDIKLVEGKTASDEIKRVF